MNHDFKFTCDLCRAVCSQPGECGCGSRYYTASRVGDKRNDPSGGGRQANGRIKRPRSILDSAKVDPRAQNS
jgi:hypothetical protein